MLTPRFKITQDENHIFITIHAPYTNVGETEVDIDGENFLFVSSPYFLRLHLPGKIIEDDKSKGAYICDSGDFNFTFNKVNSGEIFDNLDMITSLLAPKDIPNINPVLVEMLEEDGISVDTETKASETNHEYGYGFGNKVMKDFRDIGSEFPQIFELTAPEQVPSDERNEFRIAFENEKFSSDHYLADYFNTEMLEELLDYKPFWDKTDFARDSDFTEEQVAILKELPNKHYLLTDAEVKEVLIGLVDILFGYCYDKRTTLNDSTVESAWTINKLSSTLSCFCSFRDVKQVLTACYRRSLIYPLYRNFDLCLKVQNDLISLFGKGKKFIVKCLIEIYKMFNTNGDARYILNQLYITDYLIFVQKCRNEEIDELRKNIANIDVAKCDLGLDLVELEHAAHLVQQEELDEFDEGISTQMSTMTIQQRSKLSGSESSSESTSDSDSSDLDSDDTTSSTSSAVSYELK